MSQHDRNKVNLLSDEEKLVHWEAFAREWNARNFPKPREMRTYLVAQSVPVDQSFFDAYRDRFGDEQAMGYLHALSDFRTQLAEILGGGFGRDGKPQKNHFIRSELVKIFHDMDNFMGRFRTDENADISLKSGPAG